MICAIILAAGDSSRLETPKQLLSFRGRALIEHVITCVSTSVVDETIVVIGSNHEQVRNAIRDASVPVVVNNNWREGIASSIRIGLQTALNCFDNVAAVLMVACDQPYLTSKVLDDVISCYRGCQSLVACEYADTIGIPALFPSDYYDQLMSLSGDRGARVILHEHQKDVQRIPFPDGAFDIDKPDDLTELASRERRYD